MSIRIFSFARTLCLSGLGVLSSTVSCKDDSPCDPGEVYRNAGCYPAAPVGGSAGTGAAGDIAGGPSVEVDSGAPAVFQAAVGDPCADTTASTDCGGDAPICAPLPSGTACTQILCLPGEANAGACPTDWKCLQARPLPDPSVCLKL